jgi:hypothetical protein
MFTTVRLGIQSSITDKMPDMKSVKICKPPFNETREFSPDS